MNRADTPQESAPLTDMLRQMLAVLQAERQALAGLDLEAIACATNQKRALCTSLEGAALVAVDEECRGMVDAARRLNEANRQVRNLIAANVAARLDALTGNAPLYRAHRAPGVAQLR
ncbi:flagellar protein FlgN [Novosphingobium sp. ZN18A2]|uniref:flagellar protein FlgN n=1 Tax=Novosphingobium sp. ZN18A2 TaxID=3079861 RepID=UPI0030CB842D